MRFAVIAIFACAGCRQAQPDSRIAPVYGRDSGRLELLKYDSDGDGIAETVSYMDGNRVVRIEVDTNHDGWVDRWEYYGAGQRLERVGFSRGGDGREDAWSFPDSTGAVARIDVSTGGDGRVTRVEHYQDGVLVRAEEDTNADGAMDRWEAYDDSRLAHVAFDPAHTGRPTRSLVYAADGTVHVE